jgi:thymidylate synthase|tara:strand:- start:3319 stop:4221 length:903 start_codon:yes stop_codon:yes gene_type:complete
MRGYTSIVRDVIVRGTLSGNRTGIPAYTIPGAIFQHDMSQGFPLLTTKNVPIRLVASELEFFIKGITDKQWLQDRDNHIWDSWCWGKKVPYGHDSETKAAMETERDLGPIYGFQWRHFDADYQGYDYDYDGQGIDQLENLIDTINTNPGSRRMIVNAWNPKQVGEMALPPCHYCFQVTVTDPSIDEETGEKKGKLNLMWNQRSVDTALGLPFNIASYGLLLHLLAKETGYEEGKLVGHLGDVHIYENHREGLMEQLSRVPLALPKIETDNFTSIFDWKYTDSKVVDYKNHGRIDFGSAAV